MDTARQSITSGVSVESEETSRIVSAPLSRFFL
jgi:hypothetical protein